MAAKVFSVAFRQMRSVFTGVRAVDALVAKKWVVLYVQSMRVLDVQSSVHSCASAKTGFV